MEEKKFDPYQFIGFVLIAMILTWMMYQNQPVPPSEAESTTSATVVAPTKVENVAVQNDSIVRLNLQNAYGDLAGMMTPNAMGIQTLSSDKLLLEVNQKGGQLVKVQLKEFENYLTEPLVLVADDNSDFNIQLPLRDGRVLNSRDFYFDAEIQSNGEVETLTLTAVAATDMLFVIEYRLQPDSYKVDYRVRTQNMQSYIAGEKSQLEWETQAFRNSKSLDYESRYTELSYRYRGDKVDELGITGTDEETVDELQWISFRQHFFSAVLLNANPVNGVKVTSEDLSQEESLGGKYTKNFSATVPLAVTASGEIDTSFQWYFGPTDFKTRNHTALVWRILCHWAGGYLDGSTVLFFYLYLTF